MLNTEQYTVKHIKLIENKNINQRNLIYDILHSYTVLFKYYIEYKNKIK